MFCDRCGQQLSDNAQFCIACGKALGPGVVPVVVTAPQDGRVGRHIKILASLWLVYGVLRFMAMAWIFLIGRTILPSFVQDIVVGAGPFPSHFPLSRLISGGLMFAGLASGVFGILYLVAAWGLFERKPWARILTLVIGFIVLIRFPFGTALGIYTLWVLLPSPAGQEYERLAGSRV